MKVRKNKFVEKHLNFHLQTQRVKTVVADGVKEIWLSSEEEHVAMNREYTVNVFRTVVDTLTELVSEMQIATDIKCRFPWTPAARMKKVPSNVVKQQSRELTSILEAFTPYNGMEGRVGHTKAYIQAERMIGASAIAKITSVGRWSVIEALIQINQKTKSVEKTLCEYK
ncbi:hypothetical protein NC653_041570 [Populus alba x Populus x berolinensis]|uniref:Uncharacterized protein n=1 Tax=Populus alba x Populus x berolinensis TaxID=444605 RepID=A0AAD6L8V1_9ROSI|nr:hypothetical protein NC653_041570 [Populus alba x Populus x berolinensis]